MQIRQKAKKAYASSTETEDNINTQKRRQDRRRYLRWRVLQQQFTSKNC